MYFHCQQSFKSPVRLAYAADVILELERKRIAKEISDLLGYELKPKDKIRQYVYRNKAIRYKINGKGFGLIKKTTDP